MQTTTLKDYIESRYNGSQTDFAKAVGVKKPQVTQWLKKDFFVVEVEGVFKLGSFRRDLNRGFF